MKINFLQFRKAFLLVCLILSGLTEINAQTSFQWARNMGGNQNDYGKSVTVDASGNVYTTGFFIGTADFDPGPGVYTLTAIGNRDIFISKLDANGNFIWAKQFGGFAAFAGAGSGNSITTDAAGNVYTTGDFFYTVDFDPGPGVFNLSTSGGNYDLFISKLDANGNFVWAKQVGGNQNEEVYSIAIDNSSNVYMTGTFSGSVDFDPGVGTYSLTAPGGFILKLTNSGSFSMAKLISNGNSTGISIKVDGTGNIYTTGAFAGTGSDFDTGPGTYTLSDAGGADAFIQKLDNAGNFLWARLLGGPGSEQGSSIRIDGSGNVITSGYFQGTADFDPGASSYTITSTGGTNLDVYVSKLNASGNFIWAKQLGGTQQDYAGGLALDIFGDIYTTGAFGGTADFDPSASTYTLSSLGGTSVFLSKLDASGNFVWANNFGSSNSQGRGIVVTNNFDVYSTGNFNQITDFDPSAGTYTLAPNGGSGEDIFVHKLGQATCPTFSLNSSTSSFTLMCAITSLTLNAVNTNSTSGVTYTWTAPSTSTTTGASYIATAAGVYTVSASAPSTTCVVTQTLAIIQTTGNVSFTVGTTGSTCNNNGSATVTVTGGTSPFTYTWSTGSIASTISGLAPGTYSLTVKDANQCTQTNSFSVINSAASFSSVPICFVTVDSLSQYNVITWDKTLFPTADSFFVYRETGTNVYKKICSQPYSTLSQFVDTVRALYFPNTGDPNVGTYRYKMKTRDNCGNYSEYSPYHNTLYTINSSGTFSWSQLYTIEGDPNPVLAYILERDNLSTGNWAAIGSVSGTQSFIIDPNYSIYAATGSWRVRTQWSINCVASQKTNALPSISYSNRIKNNGIGIKENSLNTFVSLYPNPSSGIFTAKFINSKEVSLTIYNVTGEKVFSYEGSSLNPVTIDLSKNANGIYFAVVKSEEKTYTTKLIIQ